MQLGDTRFGVHHLAHGLERERRDQLLALYRSTRNCYSGKVSDDLLADRYCAMLASPRYQVMTLDSATSLEGSVMVELSPSGDCGVTAVCATSGAACRSLLRLALDRIRSYRPRRITSGVAPEVKIANLVFGALGFVGTGIREHEPGVVVFEVERSPSVLSPLERDSADEPQPKPSYCDSVARMFAICAPESPRYASDIAALRSETSALFAAGYVLFEYHARGSTAQCLFGKPRRADR